MKPYFDCFFHVICLCLKMEMPKVSCSSHIFKSFFFFVSFLCAIIPSNFLNFDSLILLTRQSDTKKRTILINKIIYLKGDCTQMIHTLRIVAELASFVCQMFWFPLSKFYVFKKRWTLHICKGRGERLFPK